MVGKWNRIRWAHEYWERKKQRVNNRCPTCNKLISPRAKFCLKHEPIRASFTGENNPHWKGGRHKLPNGYIGIYKPEDTRTKSHYVMEHRLVWEMAHGILPPKWQVHHINGVKDDNRLENLIALPPRTHRHSSPTRRLLKKAQARIKELEAQLNNHFCFQ